MRENDQERVFGMTIALIAHDAKNELMIQEEENPECVKAYTQIFEKITLGFILARETEKISRNRGVRYTRGRRAHKHLAIGELGPHHLRYSLLHRFAHGRRGEHETVVAVNGTFYAACPGERLVGTEKNRTYGQQSFCDFSCENFCVCFFGNHFVHISSPRKSFTHRA